MAHFSSKEDFRKYCIKKVKNIKKTHKKIKDKKIVKILDEFIELLNPSSILFYMPMGHEADINSLLKKFKDSKNIYLPFMEGKSFKMVKYRLPIKVKKFGIKEPANSFFKLSRIDLAIVPVIGVDGSFRRIGFGKGMYDIFFSKLSYRPFVIFVEIEKCFTKSQICDDYDLLGDVYVTPNEIIIRGDLDVVRVVSRKFCRYYKWRCRIFNSKKNRKK
ncbi:5-formyltetrahydrofolate cyclo-ligase [Nitrosophilus labii]|uniref:5-formyltetrahydrofolate cyclo-ligase n=1 Tax=Nitrosophilus labii TaxID=2706014 RepID=UPI0016569B92|nr:5-formyltetrahydrofolate cyclo-ligase [Nitrosophilus labii]